VPNGYAVSAIVTSPVNLDGLKYLFENLRRGDNAKLVEALFGVTEKMTAGHEMIEGHYLQIGASDELAKLCEGLIATIDGEIFENARKDMQKAKQEVERIQKEQQSKKPQ
jgi:hypothetical protein